MKIIEAAQEEKVMTLGEAKARVESVKNNEADNILYVVKYEDKLISFSGEYYKFAWKTIGQLRCALTAKFGRELSEALVENDVLQVIRIHV